MGRREKPGGEKREGLTLETPLGFSKSRNKVWMERETEMRDGARVFADRRVKVLLFYREFYTS